MQAAEDAGLDVARLHSGDLSIWSAVGEQTRRLERLKIPFTLTPGVPSFAAAAAALGRELTLPEVAQSLVLTRTSGRASAMPASESLSAFAATRATMAIHLSIHALARVVGELTPFYGGECPIALVYRASWPDERIVRGTLATIETTGGRGADGAHGADTRRTGARRARIFARARSTTRVMTGAFVRAAAESRRDRHQVFSSPPRARAAARQRWRSA